MFYLLKGHFRLHYEKRKRRHYFVLTIFCSQSFIGINYLENEKKTENENSLFILNLEQNDIKTKIK